MGEGIFTDEQYSDAQVDESDELFISIDDGDDHIILS
jgi:hypothetical protein